MVSNVDSDGRTGVTRTALRCDGFSSQVFLLVSPRTLVKAELCERLPGLSGARA